MKSYGTLVGELPTGIEFVLEGALLRIYFDFERREAVQKAGSEDVVVEDQYVCENVDVEGEHDCTLTTKLYAGANAITDYYIKWYKDTTAWADKNGQKSITVTRGDVDGTQLFIAEVYQSSGASQPIARAGVRIVDTADEFQIVCYITSSNKEVDTGQPVTVSAKIVNMTTGLTYTPTSASWTMDVMDKENWKSLKHSTTNSISVTTTETDRNGTQYDVDVLAECHFN